MTYHLFVMCNYSREIQRKIGDMLLVQSSFSRTIHIQDDHYCTLSSLVTSNLGTQRLQQSFGSSGRKGTDKYFILKITSPKLCSFSSSQCWRNGHLVALEESSELGGRNSLLKDGSHFHISFPMKIKAGRYYISSHPLNLELANSLFKSHIRVRRISSIIPSFPFFLVEDYHCTTGFNPTNARKTR